MLTNLLRLRLRLLRNYATSSKRVMLRLVIEAILLAVVGFVLHVWAARLSEYDDALVWRVAAVAGAAVSVAAFLLPAMVGRQELLERAALRGYGMRPVKVAAALVPATLVGPMLPFLLIIGSLPLTVWSGRPFGAGAGLLVVVLLTLQLTLSVLLGRALGALLREHPLVQPWVRVGGLLVLILFAGATFLMLLPRLIPELSGGTSGSAMGLLVFAAESSLIHIDESLAVSPLGALWVALAPTGLGIPAVFGRSIAVALVTIVLLFIIWCVVVAADMRATRRIVPVRERSAPVVFRTLSPTPLSAVAARCFLYWLRDPRYRIVLLSLPAIPLFVILAAAVSGIPISSAALLPLPLMLLLLGWSTLHNDIAYDSTALWSLLAVQLDGRSDRFGRAAPVILFGLALMVLGVPLTVWATGTLSSIPVVIGTSLATLLGAVGVSSVTSVRAPYPVPRPGDSAFQQPVVAGSQGIGVQATSLFFTAVVASPALLTAMLWMLGIAGPWNWLCLLFGIVIGLAVVILGVRVGGRDFDEAGPELLAYTMRN